MIHLESRSDGVLLPVRVQPGARRNAITGTHDGALKVSVTQVAEKGKANAAVAEVLCEALGLRSSQIELVSGAAARQKRFILRDITVQQLRARIDAVLGSS